jgi:DNA-binding CsgD family transcriptional regulator
VPALSGFTSFYTYRHPPDIVSYRIYTPKKGSLLREWDPFVFLYTFARRRAQKSTNTLGFFLYTIYFRFMIEHAVLSNDKACLEEKLRTLQAIDQELPAIVIVMNVLADYVEYMSPRGCRQLEITLEALRDMGSGYYDTFFNPHDVADYLPKIIAMLDAPATDNIVVTFFQQVRIAPTRDWVWHLGSTRVFIRDATGKPTHVITCVIPVDPLHHVTSKVNRLLEENNFLRHNQHVFAALTKREKEILRLMALGFSAGEIADKVHISEKTAVTHRRNIKAKIGAQSSYDLTSFAQAFDLI